MPEEIFTPESAQFYYVTLDELRAEDISEDWIDDERARRFIGHISRWVNRLTRQWFLPVRLNERLDGRGASVIQAPYFIPILRLDAVKLGRPDLVTVTLPNIAWVRKDRYVQMMDRRSYLPTPPRFVELDGVFGWLEDDYYKQETTLTAAVSAGEIHLPVNDTTNFHAGDAILLGDDPWPASTGMEIKDVDTVNSRLLVEPIPRDVAINSKVTRFGVIPLLIKRAVMILIMEKGEKLAWQDLDCPPWFTKRLTSENVEGYSYNLKPLATDYGYGGGAWTTGNPEVDDILAQYSSRRFYVGAM